MLKCIKFVFYPIFFQYERIPIILLSLTVLAILIITIILVRKELKK